MNENDYSSGESYVDKLMAADAITHPHVPEDDLCECWVCCEARAEKAEFCAWPDGGNPYLPLPATTEDLDYLEKIVSSQASKIATLEGIVETLVDRIEELERYAFHQQVEKEQVKELKKRVETLEDDKVYIQDHRGNPSYEDPPYVFPRTFHKAETRMVYQTLDEFLEDGPDTILKG